VGEDEALRFGRERRDVWVSVAPEHLLFFDAATRARLVSSVH
jgi:hypothetical protein